jgi:hypothetical protein
MPYANQEDARAKWREVYHNNPEVGRKAQDRKRRYRQRNVEFLREQKDVPCTDCGDRHPYYCMDFDHLPGCEKKQNLTVLAWTPVSLDRLREEIAKCEVVCANCHRKRTFERGEWNERD